MSDNTLYDLGLRVHHFAASNSGLHVLKSGPGVLISVTVNEPSVTNAFTLYDGLTVNPANQIALIVGLAKVKYHYDIPLKNGLAFNLIATAASITVIYR